MKFVLASASFALALSVVGCDKSTSKDPSTESKFDLNPPSGLVSVTHDGSIELRWTAANAEDDFKGYHVFAVAKKISALSDSPTYPANISGGLKLETGSIPRCATNSKFFENNFGFTASTADCEGDTEKTDTADKPSTYYLADDGGTDSAAAADEDDAPMTNMVKCKESSEAAGTKTLSLPLTTPQLAPQVCTVEKLADDTALKNGTTYTFFVVAVKGDKNNKISWTSNFVEDTPAESVYTTGSIKVAAGNYYFIPVAKLVTALAGTGIAETDLTSGLCTAAPTACSISGDNSEADVGIWLGRLGTGSYKSRTFISATVDAGDPRVEIIPRGPQVLDPLDDSFQNSIPGDAATTSGTYSQGTKYAIYGYQVFDLKVTSATKTYYGKIVFGQPTFTDATSAVSDMTFKMAIVVQPDANNPNYLTSPDNQF